MIAGIKDTWGTPVFQMSLALMYEELLIQPTLDRIPHLFLQNYIQ